MTDDAPAGDDRAAYVRALIASRCPELTEADLELLADAAADPDALPATIGMQILDLVEHMADRMDEFERLLAAEA